MVPMHFGPSRVPPIRVMGPKFEETVYISEVNGARKVKSDAQTAMNRNSDHVHKFFLRDGWERQCPNSFFSNFWNCPKRVELGSSYSGCRLIDKANSRRYDVTGR